MATDKKSVDLRRRSLLQGMGAASVGAAIGLALGGSRVAHAEAKSAPLHTTIVDFDGELAVIRSGPFETLPLPAGSRLGVCLITGGGRQGAGPRPVLERIDHALVSGVGALAADRGVEQGAYRLLGGLDTVRPVELFGVSARVPRQVETGDRTEVTWEARLRGGRQSAADLERYLDYYHACVLGLLAPNGRFSGRLAYYEISRGFGTQTAAAPES